MTQKSRPRHPEKVRNPINPIKKKPKWIRSKLIDSKEFFTTKWIKQCASYSKENNEYKCIYVIRTTFVYHFF